MGSFVLCMPGTECGREIATYRRCDTGRIARLINPYGVTLPNIIADDQTQAKIKDLVTNKAGQISSEQLQTAIDKLLRESSWNDLRPTFTAEQIVLLWIIV